MNTQRQKTVTIQVSENEHLAIRLLCERFRKTRSEILRPIIVAHLLNHPCAEIILNDNQEPARRNLAIWVAANHDAKDNGWVPINPRENLSLGADGEIKRIDLITAG